MKPLSRGYTLVELMVALMLGLLLAGAAFGVYVSGRQVGRYSDALGRYQESVRYAQSVVSEELRMAGFFGCFQIPVTTGGGDMTSVARFAQPVNVGLSASQQYAQPVRGFEGAAGGPSHKAGTDVVQVQHASREARWLSATTSATATQTSLGGSSFLASGDLAAISNCLNTTVFNVTGSASAGAGSSISHAALGSNYLPRGEPQPSQVFRFLNRFLYVREVDGRAVLTQRTVLGGNQAPVDEDIADGIEDLQFWYGFDSVPAGTTNTQPNTHQLAFLRADQVPNTTAGWRSVVSVRVCMLTVSADNGLATQSQTYTDCNGNTVSAPDTRLRFPVSFTVNLRNRVQG